MIKKPSKKLVKILLILLIALVIVLLIALVSKGKKSEENTQQKKEQRNNEVIKTGELTKDIKKFENKKITVQGYLHYDGNSYVLFDSEQGNPGIVADVSKIQNVSQYFLEGESRSIKVTLEGIYTVTKEGEDFSKAVLVAESVIKAE